MDWLGMESEKATGWEWEWYKLPDMVDQICWGENEIYDILTHREALAGTLQGLVDYLVESVTDAILIASHVGSTELNLDDRNEFREGCRLRGTAWGGVGGQQLDGHDGRLHLTRSFSAIDGKLGLQLGSTLNNAWRIC
jgi:hypothetical protein